MLTLNPSETLLGGTNTRALNIRIAWPNLEHFLRSSPSPLDATLVSMARAKWKLHPLIWWEGISIFIIINNDLKNCPCIQINSGQILGWCTGCTCFPPHPHTNHHPFAMCIPSPPPKQCTGTGDGLNRLILLRQVPIKRERLRQRSV